MATQWTKDRVVDAIQPWHRQEMAESLQDRYVSGVSIRYSRCEDRLLVLPRSDCWGIGTTPWFPGGDTKTNNPKRRPAANSKFQGFVVILSHDTKNIV